MRQHQPYPSSFDFLSANVFTARQFVEMKWDTIGPKYGPRGMTKDLAMFINFYTHESPFYPVLNKLLRDENRPSLVPYFYFIKGFLSALYALPLKPGNVKRGVKLDLSQQFVKGKVVTWWSFNSTTDRIDVLQSDMFLGTHGDRTMFDITARSLVSIKEFSSSPEEELILLPGTILEVVAVLNAGNGLTIVQMKEKEPCQPLLDFVDPDLINAGLHERDEPPLDQRAPPDLNQRLRVKLSEWAEPSPEPSCEDYPFKLNTVGWLR